VLLLFLPTPFVSVRVNNINTPVYDTTHFSTTHWQLPKTSVSLWTRALMSTCSRPEVASPSREVCGALCSLQPQYGQVQYVAWKMREPSGRDAFGYATRLSSARTRNATRIFYRLFFFAPKMLKKQKKQGENKTTYYTCIPPPPPLFSGDSKSCWFISTRRFT